jgi:membrane-associated phospholipid phosphatase
VQVKSVERIRLIAFLTFISSALCAWGQTTDSQRQNISPPKEKNEPWSGEDPVPQSASLAPGKLLRDFVQDEKDIWTSPFKLRIQDFNWLAPAAGLTAGLIVSDSEFSSRLKTTGFLARHSSTFSNGGVAALLGGSGGLYLLGKWKRDDHRVEAGILSLEAAANSVLVAEVLKFSTARERPTDGAGLGRFWTKTGYSSSFPSDHAAAAWSAASVIAEEYPGLLTQLLAYGIATGVSLTRVTGKNHFPSDVVVGSALGWLVGRQVYARHHDANLRGESKRGFPRLLEGARYLHSVGSPYVPMDSWVYQALNRLTGLGLINSGFVGLRPWTRRECVRQLREVEEKLSGAENSEAQELVDALQHEFRPESEVTGDDPGTFRLESIYSRIEYISGMPLTDGYNFGQTQFNDFGRPFSGGWNTINGFSVYATGGPWVGYFRAEEQTAASIPPLPLAARQAIQIFADIEQDGPHLPLEPGTIKPSVRQFEFLEAYAGLALPNWQVTFGKQSLLWGPGDGGSLTLSNNAQPINMLRISRTTPLKLPSILGWLGPMRTEFFLGQLAGFEFIFSPSGLNGQFGRALAHQPFIHGQKLSFKPTRNFEFGFFRTTILGGEGYSFTWHTFLRSLTSTGNTGAGAPNKPGKRLSGLDLSYRLPGLRNWLTFYAEGLAYDEFSPIAYADRSAWRAGLYLSHFPWVHKLDLRAEGVYTDNPIGGAVGHGFYYSNGTWRSGYTNNGNLMGSWIGRDGQGAQAWANYWLGARNRLQFNFRHEKISRQLMPGGGTLTDVGARGDYWVRSNLDLSASVQYEQWRFPVIQPNAQRTVTTTVQILFQPEKLFRRFSTDVAGNSFGDRGRP